LSQLSATQYVAGTFPSWPRVRLIDIHRINDQWRVVFRWTDAGSRSRGDNRLSLAGPAEHGHRI